MAACSSAVAFFSVSADPAASTADPATRADAQPQPESGMAAEIASAAVAARSVFFMAVSLL